MESDISPTDQHVDQVWDTPSHSEIIELTKAHVEAMEMTNDDLVWVQAGMHHVLLTTIGRKTGKEHKVALPTWKNQDGDTKTKKPTSQIYTPIAKIKRCQLTRLNSINFFD